MEEFGLLELAVFVVVVCLFLFFGQSVGWRAVGILQLVFSLKVIKQKRIGVGWEGRAPAFHLTGVAAVVFGIASLGISVVLLFFPEQTVMKLNP